jgi:hypothetical protein
MPRAKSLLKAGLLLGLLILLAIGGKLAGKHLARSGILHRSKPVARLAAGNGEPKDDGNTGPVRADLVATSLRRLKALATGSPKLHVDWEAQAQMDAIIAKLSAAELAEVCAGLRPLTVGSENDFILLQKVGAAWMAKDPDAALKAVLVKADASHGDYLVQEVFRDWARDDPRAALAWLDKAELPPGREDLKERFRRFTVMDLVERDFELATTEFLKTDPSSKLEHEYGSPLQNWAHTYLDDPAMRNRLVEFTKSTGRSRDYADLNYYLLRQWPQEDAMGMLNYLHELRGYLESDAVPAAERPAVDAKAVAVAIHREYDRPALEWWMERYGDSRDTPAPMRQAMSEWTQKYPDKVLQWFEEQPPSPQRDALASSVIPALIQQKKFQEAAGTIANMQDAAYRQAAVERLEILWSEQDAAAAAAWKAGQGE